MILGLTSEREKPKNRERKPPEADDWLLPLDISLGEGKFHLTFDLFSAKPRGYVALRLCGAVLDLAVYLIDLGQCLGFGGLGFSLDLALGLGGVFIHRCDLLACGALC